MSTHTEKAPMTSHAQFAPAGVNVRVKISALWTAMLFVFVYVDLFTLYRADVRADLEAGQLGPLTISQSSLLAITAYIALPALMVFLSLVLPARGARIANLSLAAIYVVTIAGSTVGESNYYYLFGSALEVALLAAVGYYAWTWPKLATAMSTAGPEAAADLFQLKAGR